jgi:hypothetical protein
MQGAFSRERLRAFAIILTSYRKMSFNKLRP